MSFFKTKEEKKAIQTAKTTARLRNRGFVNGKNPTGPRIIGRKEARFIAKCNMARAGFRRINKSFASNWRKYIIPKDRRSA